MDREACLGPPERRAGLGAPGHREVAAEKSPHVGDQRALKDIRSKLKTDHRGNPYGYREHGEDRPPAPRSMVGWNTALPKKGNDLALGNLLVSQVCGNTTVHQKGSRAQDWPKVGAQGISDFLHGLAFGARIYLHDPYMAVADYPDYQRFQDVTCPRRTSAHAVPGLSH